MTEALLIIASLSAGVWAGWVIRSAKAQEERAEAYFDGYTSGTFVGIRIMTTPRAGGIKVIKDDARTPGKVDQ